MPSPTVTTLPDDILHYSEPRILTVRECARLQSFPDWFAFQGKYTTGGKKRKMETPRYTQVGNAVPPLLAEAIGSFILKLSQEMKEDVVQSLENELRNRTTGWWERLQVSIPELKALAGTQQPAKYHAEGDVAVHTRLAIEACPENCDPDLLWAALLHDIGKPATTLVDIQSIKAHGHDKVGALISDRVLTRLGMSDRRKKRIVWAVRHHQFHHSWQLNNINAASNRHKRFVAMEDFPLLLELLKVDALSAKGHPRGLSAYEFYRQLRQSVEKGFGDIL
jgi:putative nucleotidyltransferase with HDIG domain